VPLYCPAMKVIIFDCDGVLVDSEQLSCSSWIPVLARHGISVELHEIERYIGMSDEALLNDMERRLDRPLPAEVVEEREQQYFDLARQHLRTFDQLVEALDWLAARGAPLAVASSGGPAKIRFSLELTGLYDRFGVICSATEVSHGKPAPDLFLLAACRLGVRPADCIVVEDSIFGIQAARRAGMYALGFSSSFTAPELIQAGAQQVMGHYSELPVLAGALLADAF
jgi:HAD superfamily hydrolase (TIGR01509 family)